MERRMRATTFPKTKHQKLFPVVPVQWRSAAACDECSLKPFQPTPGILLCNAGKREMGSLSLVWWMLRPQDFLGPTTSLPMDEGNNISKDQAPKAFPVVPAQWRSAAACDECSLKPFQPTPGILLCNAGKRERYIYIFILYIYIYILIMCFC